MNDLTSINITRLNNFNCFRKKIKMTSTIRRIPDGIQFGVAAKLVPIPPDVALHQPEGDRNRSWVINMPDAGPPPYAQVSGGLEANAPVIANDLTLVREDEELADGADGSVRSDPTDYLSIRESSFGIFDY